MSHLGDRLISLIDGELDHDARDRVLAHLAVCHECRAEADAQRQLKSMISDLDGPEPSDDFLRRLRTLAEPGEPMPPAPPTWPGGSAAGGSAVAFDSDTGSRPFPGPFRLGARRASFVLGGMFCLATAAATTAFVVGDRGSDSVRVTPPVDRYAVEHAVTVPRVPLTDPAAGVAVGTTVDGTVNTVSSTPAP